MAAVREHFGMSEPTQAVLDLVHEVDERVLVDEVEALMIDPSMYLSRTWSRSGGDLLPLGAEIAAMPWEQAANVFDTRFHELFPTYLTEEMT
jgi:hypothetical protein